MPNAFTPSDFRHLMGPPDAFEASPRSPRQSAIQNHLALEVVAQLAMEGIPFTFKGGTALHAKLGARRRFSIDVDLAAEPKHIEQGLRAFATRFEASQVKLREPSRTLLDDGVQHILEFGLHNPRTPLTIYVEVMPEADGVVTEPLPLQGDGYDWKISVRAPVLEEFAGQKLAVLGPTTVGKPVGLNEQWARQNQGVGKQIFDLRELLRQPLLGNGVLRAYEREVEHTARLRRREVTSTEAAKDALGLLKHLRGPHSQDKADHVRYGLWQGFDAVATRWIAPGTAFEPIDYRVTAGSLARVFEQIQDGKVDWTLAGRPLATDTVPADVAARLADAEQRGETWIHPEFGGLQRVVWAWAPARYW